MARCVWMRVAVFLHARELLVLSMVWILAFLVAVHWYLTVVILSFSDDIYSEASFRMIICTVLIIVAFTLF